MGGDLTEQTTRAGGWLTGAKWAIADLKDYRHGTLGYDLQVLTRKITVPQDLLDGVLAYLTVQTSFTNPVPKGKKLTGTWFSGHVWWDSTQTPTGEDKLTVFQILVRGAIITSTSTTAFSFTIPSASGAQTHTIVQSRNKATMQTILTAVGSTTNNSGVPSYDPATGLFSATISSYAEGSGSAWPTYSSKQIRRTVTHNLDHDGSWWETTWNIHYWVCQGAGHMLGLADFKISHGGESGEDPAPMDVPACGAKSDFQASGGANYRYVAVYKVTRKTVDVTATYCKPSANVIQVPKAATP